MVQVKILGSLWAEALHNYYTQIQDYSWNSPKPCSLCLEIAVGVNLFSKDPAIQFSKLNEFRQFKWGIWLKAWIFQALS